METLPLPPEPRTGHGLTRLVAPAITCMLGTCMLGIILAAGGCAPEAADTDPVDRLVEAVPDTVVTTESGLIGGLADWAVHPDGSLFVLDFQSRQVHVLDPGAAAGGRSLRTIGRPGQGPGELDRPASLFLGAESFMVADPGNGRFQEFTFEGEPGTSREFPDCARGPAPPVSGPRGELVRPTLGFTQGMAVVCSADGEELRRLGEHLAPGQAMVNMAELRAQVLEGEVPGILLNSASPVAGDDGGVWLVMSAARQVERYDAQGERTFRVTVDEPEFEEVRAAWIEQNRQLDVGNLAGLSYLLSAREVGGDLWVLTHVGERGGARVVVFSTEGDVRQRLEFTRVNGAGNFAVDEERGWVYFYLPDTAEVVRVHLDGVE
jgi:hypothetical protein